MPRNRTHDGPGPSQRQLRVGELIRRTLARVLAQGDIHDPDLGSMSITVSEVRTTPDLKIATVYVLPLGGAGGDTAIAVLKRNRGQLRRIIGKVTALKFTPDLRFQIDETFDRMDQTRTLFEQADIRRDLDEDD